MPTFSDQMVLAPYNSRLQFGHPSGPRAEKLGDYVPKRHAALTLGERYYDDWMKDFEDHNQVPPFTARETVDYASHFNTKIGKCLVLIDTIDHGSNFHHWILLFDANERRQYAGWMTVSQDYPTQWQKPMGCQLMLPNGETISCTSSEQFDGFVNRCMSE